MPKLSKPFLVDSKPLQTNASWHEFGSEDPGPLFAKTNNENQKFDFKRKSLMEDFMYKKKMLIMIAVFVLLIVSPELSFAEEIDPSTDFGLLLIEILGVLNGPIVTASIFFSVGVFGVILAVTPQTHDLVRNGMRILIGIILATKGAAWIIETLGLSMII